MSPTVPATARVVAGVVRAEVGGESGLHAYYDEGQRNVHAVLEVAGSPHPALHMFATTSLHAVPNLLDGRDVRVELMVVTDAAGAAFVPNVVASAAFCVSKDGWLAAPGVVFPEVVAQYGAVRRARHLMWGEPVDFQSLSTLAIPGVELDVHLLQGIPLTDEEFAFLRAERYDRLVDRLEAAEAPYHDLDRASVV